MPATPIYFSKFHKDMLAHSNEILEQSDIRLKQD
jgi:hypothetical protein